MPPNASTPKRSSGNPGRQPPVRRRGGLRRRSSSTGPDPRRDRPRADPGRSGWSFPRSAEACQTCAAHNESRSSAGSKSAQVAASAGVAKNDGQSISAVMPENEHPTEERASTAATAFRHPSRLSATALGAVRNQRPQTSRTEIRWLDTLRMCTSLGRRHSTNSYTRGPTHDASNYVHTCGGYLHSLE